MANWLNKGVVIMNSKSGFFKKIDLNLRRVVMSITIKYIIPLRTISWLQKGILEGTPKGLLEGDFKGFRGRDFWNGTPKENVLLFSLLFPLLFLKLDIFLPPDSNYQALFCPLILCQAFFRASFSTFPVFYLR